MALQVRGVTQGDGGAFDDDNAGVGANGVPRDLQRIGNFFVTLPLVEQGEDFFFPVS